MATGSDTEIVVQLTFETDQLQAGMEQGAATVQSSVDEMQSSVAAEAAAFNAAVQAKIDAQVRLNAAFQGGITSTEQLTEAESALDARMNLGGVSAAQYAEYVSTLDAAEAALATSTEAATAATVENTAAQINSRTAYSASALITDALTGQFSRSRREVAALANETGIMSSAFSFLLSPLGLATAAVVAFGVAAVEAQRDSAALEASIINTGGAYGYNADQLKQMANAIAATGATSREAKEAVDDVAGSGVIMGANFRNAAQAAADMAQTMGLSVDKAVEEIEKLQENPVKAIQALNQTMNFLSPAEAAQIVHLQDIGDKAGAAAKAIELLRNAEDARASKISAAGGGNSGLVGGFESMVSNGASGIMAAFQSGTLKDSIASVNNELLKYNEISQNAVTISSSGVTLDKSKIATSDYANLVALVEKRTALEAQITAQQEKQQQVETQTDADKAKVNATLSAHKSKSDGGSGDSGLAADDRQLFQEMQLNRTMSLAAEKAYWQSKLQDAQQGTAEYRQALQQLVDIKNKELSQDKQEGNKQATAAREAARKEVEDAREAAQERISMEREVTREMQKEAQKRQQLDLEALKSSHDEAVKELANKRQDYQNEYSAGQITAQQLLTLEDQLAAQKLAIDKKYYEDKAKIDAGNVVAVTKDNAAIVAASQAMHAQMATNEKEYLSNSEKEWNDHAKKIEGAMQSAVTGMIFQNQTLQKTLANIGMVIGEDFINQAVMKPLDRWIEGEAAKIAHSTATQATLQAQEAANDATQVARSAASVTRASGVAGANGLASFAAAPWPIDVGAPVFGASMAASALGFLSVASASGGWERVPADGMMTELHRNEMVLPAATADHVRNSMGGKGGGRGDTYHIHANDSKSFADQMRRDPRGFAAAAKHAARMGHGR